MAKLKFIRRVEINAILITGGASGLGEELTRKFATSGNYNVYFTYNKASDKAADIELEFPCAKAIKCDFTNIESLQNLLERMVEMNLDILINNALAGMKTKHFHQNSPADFLTSFKDNVIPTLSITQQAIKLFRKNKYGRIVTVLTSYLANSPPTGLSEYVANKAYLLSLSKSWANENSRFNITSNCISPSMMKTSLISEMDERQIDGVIDNIPLKRLITTKEVSDSIYFLATASQHINGTNLLINGGVDVI